MFEDCAAEERARKIKGKQRKRRTTIASKQSRCPSDEKNERGKKNYFLRASHSPSIPLSLLLTLHRPAMTFLASASLLSRGASAPAVTASAKVRRVEAEAEAEARRQIDILENFFFRHRSRLNASLFPRVCASSNRKHRLLPSHTRRNRGLHRHQRTRLRKKIHFPHQIPFEKKTNSVARRRPSPLARPRARPLPLPRPRPTTPSSGTSSGPPGPR